VSIDALSCSIPLFQAMGFSVVLNGNRQVWYAAHVGLKGDSLFEIIGGVPGLTGALCFA